MICQTNVQGSNSKDYQESGATLIEVLIAFFLFVTASVAVLLVYDRQAVTVIGESQGNTAFSVLSVGASILRLQPDQQNLNGAEITATNAPAALSAASVTPLQTAMSVLPNSKLQWTITPLHGDVCPCTASQTLSWSSSGTGAANRKITTATTVGY